MSVVRMKPWAKRYALEKQAGQMAAFLKAHHFGADASTTNAELSVLMNMPDIGAAGRKDVHNSVKLTELIKLARELGHPIAADVHGIYYARFREEAMGVAEENLARAKTYMEQATLMTNMARLLPSNDATGLSVAA